MKEYFNRKKENRKGFIIVELAATIALIGAVIFSPAIENTSPTSEDCFTLDQNGAIVEYDDTCSKDVVIPGMIDGKEITTIETFAFFDRGLTSLILPDSLETIRNNAFRDNDLTSIEFPEGVKEIGDRSFEGNNLTSITIPESVEFIGFWTFYLNGPDENSENIEGAFHYTGPTKYSDEIVSTPAEGPWTGTWILDDDSTDWKLLP